MSEICLVRSAKKSSDSYEVVTKIYPFGSGVGTGRASLAKIKRTTSATGYTLSTSGTVSTANYLKSNAGTTAYGVIELYRVYPEVGRSTDKNQDSASAEQLYQAAYEYLSRHDTPQDSYDLELEGLEHKLLPGRTLSVAVQRKIDNYWAINIDGNYVILESTLRIDESGLRTVSAKVSSTDIWARSEPDAIAESLQLLKRGFA